MKSMSKTIAVAVVLGLAFGITPPTEARNAEGAFLTNTNSIDPTRPVHVHKYKVRPGPRIRLTDSVLTKQKCSSCGKKRIWQKFKDGREGVFANQ